MPQLILNPWFLILMWTWMTLLLMLPLKITNSTTPNKFLIHSHKLMKTNWPWPWL
uniref:ATP synthase complex subunit 8 n=1 Tax=Sooglossus sechellensis TaxID=356330 RepID=K9JYW1_SOOSE|nr:ATP synthase F0 subunit 8 [Sooglossus sechellensis]